MSTLVLLLWPALGDIHLAITFVLRCSCRAWEWWEGEGQLGAWLLRFQPSLILPCNPSFPPTPGSLPPQGFGTCSSLAKISSQPAPNPSTQTWALVSHPGTCLLARTVTFSFSIFTCEGRQHQHQTLRCFSHVSTPQTSNIPGTYADCPGLGSLLSPQY